MKKIMIAVLIMIAAVAGAQTKAILKEGKKVEVTYNKTTNLVFPSSIASVDRGSQDILVEKAQGAGNVLRVKADVKGFEETNLSVITVDGKLYSFIVSYAAQPNELNVLVEGGTEMSPSSYDAEGDVAARAEAAALRRGNVRSVSDHSSKVGLELQGFFVKEDVLFCKLKLENKSRINYDIDQFHLYIRDKKKSKRTASQEIKISPLFIGGDTGTLASRTSRIIVVAVPKFTIPDGKLMIVEVMEQNGGRHLSLQAKNRHLMKARKV